MLVLRHMLHRNDRVRAIPQILFAFSTLVPLVIVLVLGAANMPDPGQIGGYLFGFSLGALAEDKYVRFTVDVSPARRILRLAVGGLLIGLLVLVLRPALSDAYLIPSFANSVIRGLFVAVIIPVVFTRIERRGT